MYTLSMCSWVLTSFQGLHLTRHWLQYGSLTCTNSSVCCWQC